jgi:hypothetical protein
MFPATVFSDLRMSSVSHVMLLEVGRSHRLVDVAFCLFHSHRSIALEGQHRDRKPQEKTEKHAHGLSMVPQTKNLHQGTAYFSCRPVAGNWEYAELHWSLR